MKGRWENLAVPATPGPSKVCPGGSQEPQVSPGHSGVGGKHGVGPTHVTSEDPGARVPAGTSVLSFLGARAHSEPGTMPGSPSLVSDPPHSHGAGMSFPHDREKV